MLPRRCAAAEVAGAKFAGDNARECWSESISLAGRRQAGLTGEEPGLDRNFGSAVASKSSGSDQINEYLARAPMALHTEITDGMMIAASSLPAAPQPPRD